MALIASKQQSIKEAAEAAEAEWQYIIL
jgi:hypothetical protein